MDNLSLPPDGEAAGVAFPLNKTESPIIGRQSVQSWEEYRIDCSSLTSQSRLLLLNCGDAPLAQRLAERAHCVAQHVTLANTSALPDGSFTDIWCQAEHPTQEERHHLLREGFRLLGERGLLLYEESSSDTAVQKAAQECLSQIGLRVLGAHSLSAIGESIVPASRDDLQTAPALAAKGLFYRCQKPSNWMTWIFESRNQPELQKKYDAWAASYDADLNQPWRFMTDSLAQTLQQSLPDKSACILDAGAGTGLVGESLAKLGYKDLTAVDLSDGMLAVARKKGIYKTLHLCALESPDLLATGNRFDGIVAAGVFVFLHAGIPALKNLFHLLRKGGVFVCTMRISYYQEMEAPIDSLPWQRISLEEYTPFKMENMYILALRKVEEV